MSKLEQFTKELKKILEKAHLTPVEGDLVPLASIEDIASLSYNYGYNDGYAECQTTYQKKVKELFNK